MDRSMQNHDFGSDKKKTFLILTTRFKMNNNKNYKNRKDKDGRDS